MVEFYLLHSHGDRVLRKSTDEYGEPFYEPVSDNIENQNSENLFKALMFEKYSHLVNFLGENIYVMKVKNYPQVFFSLALIFKSFSPCGFIFPEYQSRILIPQNSPFVVFWELSKIQYLYESIF